MTTQTKGLEEAIRLLQNFVSDRENFGGGTIDDAIDTVCEAARRYAALTPEPVAVDVEAIVSFLDKIEGQGYGGMSEFETARLAARNLIPTAQPVQGDDNRKDALALAIAGEWEALADQFPKTVINALSQAPAPGLTQAEIKEVREILMIYRKDWRDRAGSVEPIDRCLAILNKGERWDTL